MGAPWMLTFALDDLPRIVPPVYLALMTKAADGHASRHDSRAEGKE